MDSIRLDVFAVSSAHLAEWMLVKKSSPDSLPFRSVSSLRSWISLDAVVASHHEALMLLAVSSVGQVGAAWIGAGVLWFSWHLLSFENLQKRHKLSI